MVAHRLNLMAVALLGGVLAVSCAAPVAPTASPSQSVAPIAVPTQTVAPAQPAGATLAPGSRTPAGGSVKLNMDEIFPPGPGREPMLDNCITCHTFVPMVVLQMSQAQWDRNALDHRDRVPRMTDGDFKAAYAYLAKHFNPDRPVPKLPKELLDTWTDY